MKIRCKNCYRVLDPKENYCKFCGTHSEEIETAMRTGVYDGGLSRLTKVAFILFGILAFAGTGLFMTILAALTKDSTTSLYNKSNALLITSIVTTALIYIICRKQLIDYIWNGNKNQFFGSILILLLTGGILVILSKLSDVTRVIPSYVTDYLASGTARWFSGKSTNIFIVLITYILIILTEEFLFRRVFIDFLDEQTMLSDLGIILLSAGVGVICDFMWVMSVETLITSIILNIVLSGVYANTNRSLGLNVIFRILLLGIEFAIFIA